MNNIHEWLLQTCHLFYKVHWEEDKAWPLPAQRTHLTFLVQREFPDGLVVKDLALSWLWPRCDPWPGNIHMPQMQPKHIDFFFFLTGHELYLETQDNQLENYHKKSGYPADIFLKIKSSWFFSLSELAQLARAPRHLSLSNR